MGNCPCLVVVCFRWLSRSNCSPKAGVEDEILAGPQSWEKIGLYNNLEMWGNRESKAALGGFSKRLTIIEDSGTEEIATKAVAQAAPERI